jgi:hypothetical protein
MSGPKRPSAAPPTTPIAGTAAAARTAAYGASSRTTGFHEDTKETENTKFLYMKIFVAFVLIVTS